MKIDRRRVLFGLTTAALIAFASPAAARADDDDDDDHGSGYRNGKGYRHNESNRPNGNPSGNNITDQPGMSYEQSRRAGGESRETVHESALKPVHFWLTEAMSANATEAEAGRLAQERASSQEVRQFGQRTVTDHRAELEELVALAAKHGLDPIRGPSMPLHRELIQNLMTRSGQEFDRFFMRSMVLEHRTAVRHYELALKEQPEDVAANAEKTLPVLREHLALAESIAGRVGADLSGT
jgi:putative membrane protein